MIVRGHSEPLLFLLRGKGGSMMKKISTPFFPEKAFSEQMGNYWSEGEKPTRKLTLRKQKLAKIETRCRSLVVVVVKLAGRSDATAKPEH